MSLPTHAVTLPAPMIERGFWLYVWRIASPLGELLYVGRTGDSSSPNASAPFARMGQHLGTNRNQNMVRRHLERRGAPPEECDWFELVACGPLFPEAQDWSEHVVRRDVVAGLERALADALAEAGYDVLNEVRSRKAIRADLWVDVRHALAAHLPRLRAPSRR